MKNLIQNGNSKHIDIYTNERIISQLKQCIITLKLHFVDNLTYNVIDTQNNGVKII